jgi:hypothetical protein
VPTGQPGVAVAAIVVHPTQPSGAFLRDLPLADKVPDRLRSRDDRTISPRGPQIHSATYHSPTCHLCI